MKSKPMAGVLVVVSVAVISWTLATLFGPAFAGGREAFFEWRTANAGTFYVAWGIAVVVISIPALVIVGRRLQQFEDEREQAALSARGVGRLVARALRGSSDAVEKLENLLDDENPAVRYQSARALSLLSDAQATEILLRKVRYWHAPDKLALIDVLKRTRDLRCVPLMEQLAADRNPMIARKARTAMPSVAARAARMDPLEGEVRKRSAAHQRRNVDAREREAQREQLRRQRAEQGGTTPAAKDGPAAADGAASKNGLAPEVQGVPKDGAAAGDGAAAHAEATTTEADPHE
ncbi:MAG TPA: HEAT repeat domain-containing protein [Thermoleophilia bacterium]|nr:HEAT repeat domain-containing protein [Thermoleophilia bacterium]